LVLVLAIRSVAKSLVTVVVVVVMVTTVMFKQQCRMMFKFARVR
jgi:hypothetical protein